MITFQIKHSSFKSYIRQFPITTALLIIWSVLFIYSSLLFGIRYNEQVEGFGGIYDSKIYSGEYWRLLSYGYFHDGWAHFGSNILFLFFFSPPLEKYLQSSIYLTLHVISVALTGTAIFLFSKSSAVGGSGFEYALLGFYLYLAINKKPLLSSPLRTVVIIMTLVGLITSLQVHNVSVTGHVTGLLLGFVFAKLYFLYFEIHPAAHH